MLSSLVKSDYKRDKLSYFTARFIVGEFSHLDIKKKTQHFKISNFHLISRRTWWEWQKTFFLLPSLPVASAENKMKT